MLAAFGEAGGRQCSQAAQYRGWVETGPLAYPVWAHAAARRQRVEYRGCFRVECVAAHRSGRRLSGSSSDR